MKDILVFLSFTRALEILERKEVGALCLTDAIFAFGCGREYALGDVMSIYRKQSLITKTLLPSTITALQVHVTMADDEGRSTWYIVLEPAEAASELEAILRKAGLVAPRIDPKLFTSKYGHRDNEEIRNLIQQANPGSDASPRALVFA